MNYLIMLNKLLISVMIAESYNLNALFNKGGFIPKNFEIMIPR